MELSSAWSAFRGSVATLSATRFLPWVEDRAPGFSEWFARRRVERVVPLSRDESSRGPEPAESPERLLRDVDPDSAMRTLLLLQRSRAFRSLPVGAVQELVGRMRLREVDAGETITEQGDVGETFFVIDAGRAEVWQEGLYDDEPQLVRTLAEGDCFGDAALITGGRRSATVRMIERGRLMTLDKDSYLELISNHLLRRVEAEHARDLLEQGHELLDVRYVEEHTASHIPGAQLIPLHELRSRLGELDPHKRYVVYCLAGKRSDVAALLLSQHQFRAVSLVGGIRAWPYEAEGSAASGKR